MLSIGQFARSTGLTVKALRHYDERGLLVPATVDPDTRRRAYGGAQVRDAVVIKALRAADVPVPSVRRALDDPAVTREVLEEFRAEVTAARAVQDAAFEAVDYLIRALEKPAPVVEREQPAQHYAAVVMWMPSDGSGVEEADSDSSVVIGALHRALTEQGNPPSGPYWTGFDTVEDDPATAELTLCWPTDRPGAEPPVVAGHPTRVGTLPPRRELVARWSHDDADTPPPPGVPHPIFVALLSELVRREGLGGGDAVETMVGLRQIVVPRADGPPAMELAMALR